MEHTADLFDQDPAPAIARARHKKQYSGDDQLQDELACIDLGHSEKRFNQPIELTTYADNLSLLIRQHQAMNWIHRNPVAEMNRARSCRVLLGHPALPSVTHFLPQLRVV